jgi:hypothetical protein
VPHLDLAARVRRIDAPLAGLHRESALVRQIPDAVNEVIQMACPVLVS